jgi:hypothetical protein
LLPLTAARFFLFTHSNFRGGLLCRNCGLMFAL